MYRRPVSDRSLFQKLFLGHGGECEEGTIAGIKKSFGAQHLSIPGQYLKLEPVKNLVDGTAWAKKFGIDNLPRPLKPGQICIETAALELSSEAWAKGSGNGALKAEDCSDFEIFERETRYSNRVDLARGLHHYMPKYQRLLCIRKYNHTSRQIFAILEQRR
jgi:hypothetical protein